MSEHTPTPWENYGDFIRGPEDGWICQFFDKYENDFNSKDANVARIVECVNGYDALLDRIAELEKEVETLKCNAESSAQFNASAAESAHGSRSNKPASKRALFLGNQNAATHNQKDRYFTVW